MNLRKEKILFEGAQVLLDVDHGTYPYAKPPAAVPSTAATGSGSGPNNIGYI